MKSSRCWHSSTGGRLVLMVLCVSFFLGSLARAGEDLGKVYKSKLDHDEGRGGVDWTAGPDDVWALSSFRYVLKGKFELELGPSTVVFGKHATGKKDRGVVWAAVFPDEPAPIALAGCPKCDPVASEAAPTLRCTMRGSPLASLT